MSVDGVIQRQLLQRVARAPSHSLHGVIYKCIKQGLVHKSALDIYGDACRRHLPELNSSQIARLLHALALAKHRNFHLYSQLMQQMHKLEPSLADVTMTLVACGKLHFSDAKFTHKGLNLIVANLHRVSPLELVSILHGVTKLRLGTPTQLSTLLQAASRIVDSLHGISLTNLVIAASKILGGGNVTTIDCDKALETILACVARQSANLDALDQVRSLVALARLVSSGNELKHPPSFALVAHALGKTLKVSQLLTSHAILALEALVHLNLREYTSRLVRHLKSKQGLEPSTPEMQKRLEQALDKKNKLI